MAMLEATHANRAATPIRGGSGEARRFGRRQRNSRLPRENANDRGPLRAIEQLQRLGQWGETRLRPAMSATDALRRRLAFWLLPSVFVCLVCAWIFHWLGQELTNAHRVAEFQTSVSTAINSHPGSHVATQAVFSALGRFSGDPAQWKILAVEQAEETRLPRVRAAYWKISCSNVATGERMTAIVKRDAEPTNLTVELWRPK